MPPAAGSIVPDFRTAHHLDGFPTPDGRFRFKPDWASFGPRGHLMPRLPDHMPAGDEPTPRKPYRLVAAPARQFLNSSFTEMPTSRQARAAADGAAEPRRPWRSSGWPTATRSGSATSAARSSLHAKARDGQQATTIVVESIWPNRYWPEGIGINLLLSADPAPPNGGAAIHDTAVWLEPVGFKAVLCPDENSKRIAPHANGQSVNSAIRRRPPTAVRYQS